MEYQRLGDYIRPVDVRNRDLKVNLSQGICNAKYFQNPKQVADNPETHKVVRTGQFAYNRATTRNGDKISIALREGPDCTVSSAYQVFEIVDENQLDPKYLMMWFKRPEFDRLAIFYSHGSAHEFFEWDAMCEVRLPIPSIARQREIVEEYETLSRRIRLNEQMIARLEETAQALYRKMFVDGIDKENLPEGWRRGRLGEIAECYDSKRRPVAGYDRDKMEPSKRLYPYYGAAALMDYVDDYIFDGEYILMGEDGTVINEDNTPVVQYVRGKFWVNNHAHILKGKNGFDENLLFLILRNADVHELVTGGVQAKINQENMMKIPAIIPPQDKLEKIKKQISPVFQVLYLRQQENSKLTELQSLLLARMGK
ncbi:MAG: restriction endonuclease subunit S [Bacteroidales bacterium]|nr:restriction endonuclease subunit S [Bacteroidales bacterium]